jgi:outer membrane cobalamin receptor
MRSLIHFTATALLLSGCLAAQVRIRIVDSRDAAIPEARVEVKPQSGAPVSGVTTLEGTVTLDVTPPLDIRAEAVGFEPARLHVASAVNGEITLRLEPAIVRTTVDVIVRDDTASAPTVGSALEIERSGARTVLDAVEKLVPGAFITRRGVMGYGIATNGTGVISIRGIGEQPNAGVLVVVDGRPDYQGLMGHPLPDFYSLSDAAVVSVTEGPASVLYGSNAMGGVVEIKPARPHEGSSTRLTSSLGSFHTGQHRLSHGARFGRTFYSLAAGISHTAGDRPSSAFRDQDATAAVGYDFSSAWKFSADGRYGHFHVEDPGPVTAPLANSHARVGRGGFGLNLDNSLGRTWGYARFYSSFGNHHITDGFHSTDRTTGMRVDQQFALTPNLTLEAGSDIVNYGGQAVNVLSHLDYGRHHLTSAAGFSRIEWIPLPRLRLHTGLRGEHNSQFGGIVTPEFGVALSLREGYTVSADVGRGFRNPTIRELYLFPAPNPALQPESLWNYQASFRANPLSTLTLTATAYYADLSDAIVTTGRYPNLALRNTGRSLNRGIETSARWRPHRRLAVQSGYAWLRSTNLAPYVPAHKWNYSVELDAGRAFLHFGGVAVGERWADTGRSSTLAGYTLATLRVTVPVTRRTSVFSLVDNLFNRRYEVVPGYPMPGTNAAGGFTVNF